MISVHVIAPVGFEDQGLVNTVLSQIGSELHDVGGVSRYITTGQSKGIDCFVAVWAEGRNTAVQRRPAQPQKTKEQQLVAQRERDELLLGEFVDAVVIVFPGAEKHPRTRRAVELGMSVVRVVLDTSWPALSPPLFTLE